MNHKDQTHHHLLTAIQSVCQRREEFVYQSSRDFIRHRKLPMATVIQSVLQLGAKSLQSELLNQWNFNVNTPTTSAFGQARSKLKVSAFHEVFIHFNQTGEYTKTYRGFQLVAHDGSSINLPYNPEDKGTYLQASQSKGYNLLHMNALYDVLNKQFVNVDFQETANANERTSLCEMARSSTFKHPAIFLCDRGYPSFNVFEHLNQLQHKYVIRCKDVGSTGFLRKSDLPETDEFDTILSFKLTYLQTKSVKEDPSFRFLASSSTFDFLERGTQDSYDMSFRVVRFKLSEDCYECLVTNLDDSFTPNDLKELYHLRWGIETSFRDLKHAVNLESLHSKSRRLIYQEIYAKLIMYNFTMRLVQQVSLPKRNNRWTYQVNAKLAFELCRQYFRDNSLDILRLIQTYILPIRPDRHHKRTKIRRGFIGFHYR